LAPQHQSTQPRSVSAIYDLFNDAISSSDLELRMTGQTVNNELEKIWDERVMI
jgi:hypothetical protein